MARTIEAPGVEWKEYDLSQIAPAAGGPVALVMGFADKGQKETVYNITGSSTDRVVFGEPTNEAERYFYKARMKVLDSNGTLLAAKIPYANVSEGKYRAVQYKLEKLTVPTVVSSSDLKQVFAKSLVDFTNLSGEYETETVTLYSAQPEDTNNPNPPSGALSVNVVGLITKKTGSYEDVVSYYKENETIKTVSDAVPRPSAWTGDSGYYYDANRWHTVSLSSDCVDPNGFVESIYASPATKLSAAYSIGDAQKLQMSEDDLNIYRIGLLPEEPSPVTGCEQINSDSIAIVDISHAGLKTDAFGNERLGLFPVIVAAGNVLDDQSLMNAYAKAKIERYETTASGNTEYSINSGKENCVSTVSTFDGIVDTLTDVHVQTGNDGEYAPTYPAFGTGVNAAEVVQPLLTDDSGSRSLSKTIRGLFPNINIMDDGSLDTENLFYVTVAVVEAYTDRMSGNKVNFRILESFTGSPFQRTFDKTTGESVYLGDIINGTSNYIEFYSTLGRKIPGQDNKYVDKTAAFFKNSILVASLTDKVSFETGFTAVESRKDISVSRILQSIQSIFNKLSNINAQDIDYVVDAGVSNIAQYASLNGITPEGDESGLGNRCEYKPTQIKWNLKTRDDTLTWRSVYALYNTFCQLTRKDCMFLLDGLRPLCLDGSQKVIRPTKPSNTIDVNIIPKLNFMAGLNTSYGAAYVIWDLTQDEFTGEYFWRPPSIAAVGVNMYTDLVANYWDAPAGLNRGIVADSLDIAFNPSPVQAGMIYKRGWNYMINWPTDGITIEGQKTLQVKPSAFDRINVRKLFLRLERQTYKTCRYFVYENNTAFTRQRLVDTISPMFSDAKVRGGLYDYKIVCDAGNNTPEVIDRNELVVDIALKPARAAEFIQLNFYALRTGASWSEAGL